MIVYDVVPNRGRGEQHFPGGCRVMSGGQEIPCVYRLEYEPGGMSTVYFHIVDRDGHLLMRHDPSGFGRHVQAVLQGVVRIETSTTTRRAVGGVIPGRVDTTPHGHAGGVVPAPAGTTIYEEPDPPFIVGEG